MEEFKLVDIGHVKYDKPILVIYNPSSGRRLDRRMLIVNELRKNNLVFAIKETLNQPGLDADDIIKQADLPRYSAVIVVGGDGTIHKTVNGMLQRSDGLSLPIGLLPNGSGNDTCRGLSYSTV